MIFALFLACAEESTLQSDAWAGCRYDFVFTPSDTATAATTGHESYLTEYRVQEGVSATDGLTIAFFMSYDGDCLVGMEEWYATDEGANDVYVTQTCEGADMVATTHTLEIAHFTNGGSSVRTDSTAVYDNTLVDGYATAYTLTVDDEVTQTATQTWSGGDLSSRDSDNDGDGVVDLEERWTYTYDDAGRLVESIYTGGTSEKVQRSTFDDAGRLVASSSAFTGGSFEYSSDNTWHYPDEETMFPDSREEAGESGGTEAMAWTCADAS